MKAPVPQFNFQAKHAFGCAALRKIDEKNRVFGKCKMSYFSFMLKWELPIHPRVSSWIFTVHYSFDGFYARQCSVENVHVHYFLKDKYFIAPLLYKIINFTRKVHNAIFNLLKYKIMYRVIYYLIIYHTCLHAVALIICPIPVEFQYLGEFEELVCIYVCLCYKKCIIKAPRAAVIDFFLVTAWRFWVSATIKMNFKSELWREGAFLLLHFFDWLSLD